MSIRTFMGWLWCLVYLPLALPSSVLAADISAEMAALLSDVLKPYRAGGAPPAGADPQAVEAALAILKQEKLLDLPRPPTGATGIVEAFGKALALGTRSPQFRSEIGAIHDALTRGDKRAAKDAIRDLYQKAGRTPPDTEATQKLYEAVRAVHGTEPKETQRVEIKRPDYSVTLTAAHGAGKMQVQVLGQQGPNGQPFRTVFEGDVVTRPDSAGKGLELAATPAPAPRTITAAQAQALRDRLNGRWIDQDGQTWEVSGSGADIVLTNLRPGRTTLTYRGRYQLARATGTHTFVSPDDMSGDLPGWVHAGLVDMKLGFRVALTATAAGDRLEGTWSSQHVTYSPGSQTIEKVHDPYDRPLVLTRTTEKVAQGAKDNEEP